MRTFPKIALAENGANTIGTYDIYLSIQGIDFTK